MAARSLQRDLFVTTSAAARGTSQQIKTMSTKKKSSIPADKVELYEKVLAGFPEIERNGAANPYTSLNGNMFSLLHSPEGKLALRLPQDAREEFVKKYKTTLFEAYGTVMKEYVAVPDSMLAKTAELRKYFKISYDYAKTLKPKATKKRR